ncbi:MAG TPA: hypothetical protein VFI39_07415 [Gemmatimonadales bacterium]|nr:hypothetical protein [Gemmatimonadales bacterium]
MRALPAESPADAAVSAAAARWRSNDQDLTLTRERLALAPALRIARAGGDVNAALLIVGVNAGPPRVDSLLHLALADAWRSLGLGATKVGVAIVVDLSPGTPHHAAADSTPTPFNSYLFWALPDSSDRSTCTVVIADRFYARRLLQQGRSPSRTETSAWLATRIGPCALIARFGVPGPRVRHWLGGREWDLAQQPTWRGALPSDWARSFLMQGGPVPRWWWRVLDEMRPAAHACLGGRASACRAAVAEGDAEASTDSHPRIVEPNPGYAFNRVGLLEGAHYLFDVADAIGPQRFQDFWNTALPVDSALSLALGKPVGRWTAEWQRRTLPTPPLGPMPSPADAAIGLGAAIAAVALLLLSVHRRVVR